MFRDYVKVVATLQATTHGRYQLKMPGACAPGIIRLTSLQSLTGSLKRQTGIAFGSTDYVGMEGVGGVEF